MADFTFKNTARLVAIEMRGFKSFAREVRLDFGAGMTAVIGPNGSGKSNLAEAVRWVLGEQSVKQLRGKDRTDVIFAGSGERTQAQKAVVALTFDNTNEWFPLEASQVEIRRELTRSGESTYLLNREAIRLIDLQQMLAEAGIGAKSFTVISQGMVDRYLTASPEKRQELFDEATGIRGLQISLQQTERKLAETQGHAQDLRMVLEELQPRLVVLERQIERERERVELEKIFEDKQAIWLSQEWQRRERAVSQGTARYEAITEQIEQARRARKQVEEVLVVRARAKDPSDRVHQQLWQAEQELRQHQEAYQRREGQRATLIQSIEQIAVERKEAELHLSAARKALGQDQGESMREALERCLAVMHQWQAGATVEATAVREAITAAEAALKQTETKRTSEQGQLLGNLEQWLRTCAQLQAREEERSDQLRQLPALPVPDETIVQSLRERKQDNPKASSGADDLSKQLAQVREAEIMAEREGSAAQAALQQSHSELHDLEQVVLRERGSEFWAHIQKGNQAAGPTVELDELRSLEQRMHQLGNLDPLAKKEYEEVRVRHEELTKQLVDIEQTEANIRQAQESLQAKLEVQFQKQLAVIGEAFGRYFERLFGGGKAHLEPTEEGIDITVAPPGKRARHMALLSGGERALTSLALLLAILEASKPPFIVLDEVDAALDEANSRRLAAILREKSEDTQCIIITHNRESMGRAERLYGVTMQEDGVSKVYSVQLSDLPAEVDEMPV